MKSIICAICGQPALARRRDQNVCSSPACQKERKRRHGFALRVEGKVNYAMYYAGKKADPIRWKKMVAQKKRRRWERASDPALRRKDLEMGREENQRSYRKWKEKFDQWPPEKQLEWQKKRREKALRDNRNRAHKKIGSQLAELAKRGE